MRRRLVLRLPQGPSISPRRLLVAAAAVGGLTIGALAPAIHRPEGGDRAAIVPSVSAAVHAQSAGAGGPTYALPLANFLGEDDICESWIAVQNVGGGPGQPVAVFLTDRPEGTPTPSVTPVPWKVSLKYEFSCGGLLRPGSAWSFFGAQVATGSRSGFILSVDGATLAAVGGDVPGGDDVQGGRVCQRLKERLKGSEAEWRRFYAAWRSGGAWEGLPLGLMAGPPLSVTVHRSCPGLRSPGVDTTAAYAAPRLERAPSGRHRAAIAPLRRPTVVPPRAWQIGDHLHLMNVGIAPGTFELRFQPLGSCDPPPAAQTVGVGVGEEVPLDLMRASVGSGDLAIIEGDQPFAAVVANADDDQSTALAVASRPAGAGPIPSTALAAAVPLYPGTTRVRVDIVNAGTAPLVPRLSLYGPAGRAAGPAAPPVTGAAVCPGAHATLSVTTTLAAGPPRAHLVWIDAAPGGAEAALEATVGVAAIGGPGAAAEGRASYRIEARPVRGAATIAETPPLALPAAYDDLTNSGLAHVLTVARTGDTSARWDYVIDFYDHNGRTGRHCGTLLGTSGDVIDLVDLALLAPGMKSAAVVTSAAFEGGSAPGDIVATSLCVKGTRASQDVPGDEWAAESGAPVGADWRADGVGAACGPVLEPAPQGPPDSAALRAAVFAPVVQFLGQDRLCDAEVTITNHGAAPAAVVHIAWGEPGFCEPDCAAPLAVGCLPLIAPGASFTFIETERANSAVFLSVAADTLADLGLRPGDERTGAAVLCANPPLANDCNAWRQLWLTWQHGGTFADLPMARLIGPPITATVKRSCRGDDGTPATGSATYPAPTGAEALAAETRPDRFVYGATDLAVAPFEPTRGRDTVYVYIQNASARCTGVDVTFTSSAGDVRHCDIVTLSPGEAYQLDIRDCTDGPWRGSVTLSSSGPLAIAVDRHARPLESGIALPGAPPTPGASSTPATPGVAPTPSPTRTAAATPSATADGAAERIYLPIARRVR